MIITQEQLDRLNAERDKLGLAALSVREAGEILRQRNYSGEDPAAYLISLASGTKAMSTQSASPLVPRKIGS